MKKQTTVKPTQEEKEQYFAAHWSVPCINNEQWIWRNNDKFKDLPYGSDISECYAELISIADITDQHAIELGIISLGDDYDENVSDLECMKYCRDEIISSKILSVKEADYLRSKGYAIDWMGYTVEQLCDFGWLKLKQKGGEGND